MNICRNRQLPGKGLPDTRDEMWTVWSPLHKEGYGYPQAFGVVEFGGGE